MHTTPVSTVADYFLNVISLMTRGCSRTKATKGLIGSFNI